VRVDGAEARHHVVSGGGRVVTVRARGDVVVGGGAAEPVEQRAWIAEPRPAELVVELRGVAGPLWCCTRCAADDVPAAVLQHVVARQRVSLERNVGHEPCASRGNPAARLERRPCEDGAHTSARPAPPDFGPIAPTGRTPRRHASAAGGRGATDADHVRGVGGIVDRKRVVAVEAPVVAGRGEPRLPDGVRVCEDGVVRLLQRGRETRFARSPARRHDVPGIVGDDAVVHGGEVGERRRRRHVVQDARAGRGRMRVLDVERDLERVLHAELAACRVGHASADLPAPRRQIGKTPLGGEGRVVRILPGVRARDDEGLARAIKAGRGIVEGGEVGRPERAAMRSDRRVRCRRGLGRSHPRTALGEIVEPDHADHDGGDVGRE